MQNQSGTIIARGDSLIKYNDLKLLNLSTKIVTMRHLTNSAMDLKVVNVMVHFTPDYPIYNFNRMCFLVRLFQALIYSTKSWTTPIPSCL